MKILKIQEDKNNEPKYKKTIIHKQKEPLFVFVKVSENRYGPRVKSAPPLSIPENVEEIKPVLLKADGTPLTELDLSDISSSEESEDSSSTDNQISENCNITDQDVSNDRPRTICCFCELKEKERKDMFESLLSNFRSKSRKNFYTIQDILSSTERKVVELNLCGKKVKNTKSSYVINKKDTIVELARLELNKLTSKNMKSVISRLKDLDLQTVEDAKEIANIVVSKAVSEPTFVYNYAYVVGELKKVLKSKEEQHMNVRQTAFFGTILTKTLNILSEKIEWADPNTELKIEDFKTRSEYETKLEELETQRYTKKNRTLGAVDFLCQMYTLNVISIGHLKNRIDDLLQQPHPESVEVLCYFVNNIGEKLVHSNKESVVVQICTYLEKVKDNYENRIKFMIEDLLDLKKKWKAPVPLQGNRFACLEVDEGSLSQVVNEEEVVPQEEEIEDDSKLLSVISNIALDLKDIYDDEDKEMVFDSVDKGVKEFGKKKFYTSYLTESISDFKKTKVLVPFFIDFYAKTNLLKEEIIDICKHLKESLTHLKYDFPLSTTNYSELISLLFVKNIIDKETFEELKNKEFEIKSKDIISKWNKDSYLKKYVEKVFINSSKETN